MTLLALLLPAAVPADADAAHWRRVCARQAVLYDSPSGFVVGYVRRGQRVRYLRANTTRRWAAVRSTTGRFGWVRMSTLCPR